MSALRLGVMCITEDQAGQILLSQRSDLGVWNLPGGRLDVGESLITGGLREVKEETGIEADFKRFLGLYYLDGWGRMNILLQAEARGGKLVDSGFETKANAYFPPTAIPDSFWGHEYLIAQEAGNCHIIRSEASALRRVKWQLRKRWVLNLLKGHREPAFPQFDINAQTLVRDANMNFYGGGETVEFELPVIKVDGQSAPWVQVQEVLKARIPGLQERAVWVGCEQDLKENRFIFSFVFQSLEVLPEAYPPDYFKGTSTEILIKAFMKSEIYFHVKE
ncbi:hypothetical protein MASR2M15_05500 [Anaerolineales bacterium]